MSALTKEQWKRVLLFVAALVPGVVLLVTGPLWLGLLVHWLPIVVVAWGTFVPGSQLFGKKILRNSDEPKGMWLTFDDGPDPETTPMILELLEKAGVRATFFLIGEKGRRYPELVRAIAAGGHSIGNHSASHPRGSFWAVGPWRARREVGRCQEVLEEILGKAPVLFRPPVGHANFFLHPVLRAYGLQLIGWSCRGLDGVSTSAEGVLERLGEGLTSDAIVLVHESTPIAEEVVRGLLALAEERGLTFADGGDAQLWEAGGREATMR